MIGFGASDIGYLNVGGVNTWNDTGESYPTFKMNTTTNGWSTEVNNIKKYTYWVCNISRYGNI